MRARVRFNRRVWDPSAMPWWFHLSAFLVSLVIAITLLALIFAVWDYI